MDLEIAKRKSIFAGLLDAHEQVNHTVHAFTPQEISTAGVDLISLLWINLWEILGLLEDKFG